MPKRIRKEMKPEVAAAVNDILHGGEVDSPTEWLQREYIRLMRRELQMRANVHRESKLNTKEYTPYSSSDGTDRVAEDRPTK